MLCLKRYSLSGVTFRVPVSNWSAGRTFVLNLASAQDGGNEYLFSELVKRLFYLSFFSLYSM